MNKSEDKPSPRADRMKNRAGYSIQKKEFNLSPPMNVDPELVKKLAELTDKIDKFEKHQERGDTQESLIR